MHTDAPHHRYYRALEGRWRGRIRFEVTDPKRLQASGLRLMDRWSLWSMALASRRPVTLVLSTTLDYAGGGHRGEVRHTTRTTCLGVTVYRGRETILLADDGRSFRMEGAQAFFPRLWAADEWAGDGAVDADHGGAVYRIPFFGERMEQRTRVVPEGLEIVQTTPFSRAAALLRRRPSPRTEPGPPPDRRGA
jgi:hypothetical protein